VCVFLEKKLYFFVENKESELHVVYAFYISNSTHVNLILCQTPLDNHGLFLKCPLIWSLKSFSRIHKTIMNKIVIMSQIIQNSANCPSDLLQKESHKFCSV
jgi:hypothetical protein